MKGISLRDMTQLKGSLGVNFAHKVMGLHIDD